MNLPNKLTIFRIILIPVIILVFIPYESFGIVPACFNIGGIDLSIIQVIALVIYVVAAITDALDGNIARSVI